MASYRWHPSLVRKAASFSEYHFQFALLPGAQVVVLGKGIVEQPRNNREVPPEVAR